MEKAEEILIQKSIRITPMRQMLLEYFLDQQSVIGLSELELVFPKGDRITMYRTLKTFEENGIIHTVEKGGGEVKYGLCHKHCTPSRHKDQHPHFHCIKCGESTCLETILIPPIELPDRYIAAELRMDIKGICGQCAE